MTKEDLIKIIKSESEVHELDINKAYILQIVVGEMSRESVASLIKRLQEKLKEIGLNKIVFMPVRNLEDSAIRFFEVKDDKVSEIR